MRLLFVAAVLSSNTAFADPFCGPGKAEFGDLKSGFCAPVNAPIVERNRAIGCANGEFSRTGCCWKDEEGVEQNYRTDDFGNPKPHKGIDLAGASGDYVYAAQSGTLYATHNFRDSTLGRVVSVEHSDKSISRYAHLGAEGFSAFEEMTEDSPIAVQQIVGRVGASGNADKRCPHLHFEISRIGTWGYNSRGEKTRYFSDVLDPLEWLGKDVP